ncbi:MAG: cyclic nucleotide-binding domain-containing protein [Nitrospinales bacterium]
MSSIGYLQGEPNQILLPENELVFSEGQSGDNMYAVMEGEIDLLVADKTLETIGVGGIFGEMALIDGSPRSTTAKTKCEAKLAVIDKDRFLFLIQNTPNFALDVMHIMAERIRSGNGVWWE